MGYLLPIQPIQSQQYANRMNLDPYNFAYIGRIQRIKLNSDSFEDVMEQSFSQNKGEDKEQPHIDRPAVQYQGYVPPNPANLSPSIAHVVGKGLSVNAYV